MMELTYLFFLSSGLFLGFSLGANDVSNIFGAAVGSKLIKFKAAALIATIFVIIGAVYGGGATTRSLTQLGQVNALAGAFMVALSAALSVYFMAKTGLTTSTSQAIVGGIIGWNLYAGHKTDLSILFQIATGWILCPILSAVLAVLLYFMLKNLFHKIKLHVLMQDQILRMALVCVGAFCTYALGANNIANVMGVFTYCVHVPSVHVWIFHFSGLQILFLLGGIAISFGIWTYSQKTMETIGQSLMKMSPFVAFVVILSEALALFVFSSETLQNILGSLHLPSLPLVPVSSTQAVIGAILGIALLKGGRGVNWSITGRIVMGWVTTPLMSLIICFISLFFLENVFQLQVFLP